MLPGLPLSLVSLAAGGPPVAAPLWRVVGGALLGGMAALALGPYLRRQGSAVPAWAWVGGLGLILALVAAVSGPAVHLLPALALALGLSVAAAIDLHTYRIPNAVVLAILASGALAQALGVGWVPLLPALGAGLACGAAFALFALLSRGGFGWGDVKLAAATGWLLGPRLALLAMCVTALVAGLVAVGLLLARRRGLHDALPFAPFFLAGGLVALCLGVH